MESASTKLAIHRTQAVSPSDLNTPLYVASKQRISDMHGYVRTVTRILKSFKGGVYDARINEDTVASADNAGSIAILKPKPLDRCY